MNGQVREYSHSQWGQSCQKYSQKYPCNEYDIWHDERQKNNGLILLIQKSYWYSIFHTYLSWNFLFVWQMACLLSERERSSIVTMHVGYPNVLIEYWSLLIATRRSIIHDVIYWACGLLSWSTLYLCRFCIQNCLIVTRNKTRYVTWFSKLGKVLGSIPCKSFFYLFVDCWHIVVRHLALHDSFGLASVVSWTLLSFAFLAFFN